MLHSVQVLTTQSKVASPNGNSSPRRERWSTATPLAATPGLSHYAG
jgi:hypothetical protein